MRISDLQDKNIININTGQNLGRIIDLEIDEEGNILNLYAMPKRFFFKLFLSNKETVFKMDDITKIGKDVILVSIN